MLEGERIPDEILDAAIAGTNLSGATLRDEIGGEPTLLVFLRHFG
ncbi:MAG: hypothetical protein ACYTGZ_12520 [Planctomycetota bacterium]|jgi:hypothetical protein